MSKEYSAYLALITDLLEKRNKNQITEDEEDSILEKLDEYWSQLDEFQITQLEEDIDELDEYKKYIQTKLGAIKKPERYKKFFNKDNFNYLKVIMPMTGEKESQVEQLKQEAIKEKNIINSLISMFELRYSPISMPYVMGHAASWETLIIDLTSEEFIQNLGGKVNIDSILNGQTNLDGNTLKEWIRTSQKIQKLISEQNEVLYLSPLLAFIYLTGLINNYLGKLISLKYLAYTDVMYGDFSASDMFEELASFERSPERLYTAIVLVNTNNGRQHLTIAFQSNGRILSLSALKIGWNLMETPY